MIPLIVVEGPTASGKTSLAIEIAKALNGEIVSADSMQIYKHMDIATAKPSVDEMQNIPHHLLDFLDISEKYSVSDYVNDATTAINNIVSRSKIPILCGGTGLYIDTLVKGIDFTSSGENSKIREQLSEIYDQNGGEVLWVSARTPPKKRKRATSNATSASAPSIKSMRSAPSGAYHCNYDS